MRPFASHFTAPVDGEKERALIFLLLGAPSRSSGSAWLPVGPLRLCPNFKGFAMKEVLEGAMLVYSFNFRVCDLLIFFSIGLPR